MPIDKVVITASLFNQLVQNRIYLQCEVFQEVEEVCAHVWNSWVGTLRQWQHAGLRYSNVTATRIDPPSGLSFTEVRSVFGAQAEETQGLSFGCALLQFQTGVAGRGNKGRYYAAGYRQGATHLGQFDASELINWNQQIALLKQAYIGPQGGSTGLGLLIRHEDTGGFHPVVQIGIRPIIAVQRRRNIGVGS